MGEGRRPWHGPVRSLRSLSSFEQEPHAPLHVLCLCPPSALATSTMTAQDVVRDENDPRGTTDLNHVAEIDTEPHLSTPPGEVNGEISVLGEVDAEEVSVAQVQNARTRESGRGRCRSSLLPRRLHLRYVRRSTHLAFLSRPMHPQPLCPI